MSGHTEVDQHKAGTITSSPGFSRSVVTGLASAATASRFAEEPEAPEPLDLAAEHPERFGSYHQLIKLEAYRYEGERAPKLSGPTLPEVLQTPGRS